MRQKVRLQFTAIVLILGAILHFEYFCYAWLPFYWDSKPAEKFRPDDGTVGLRVLLIADPQLQGFRDEPKGLLGVVTRYDSDKYLWRTFRQALHFVEPHLIAFLGDLFDEGHFASKQEFDVYLGRFQSIYSLDPGQSVIFLPGDNDIGGEGDPVSEEKQKRFRSVFISRFPNAPWRNRVNFSEFNVFAENGRNMAPIATENPVPMILLGHTPFAFAENWIAPQVKLVISADIHKGSYSLWSRQTHQVVSHRIFESKGHDVLQFHLNSSTNLPEITVPTCSYRMGVPEMAFGVLRIDLSTMETQYSNLWLPSRYTHLSIEAGIGLLIAVTGIGVWYARRRNRSATHRKSAALVL